MVHRAGDLALAPVALEEGRVGEERRVGRLQHDELVGAGIACQVRLGVGALAELLDDLVAVDARTRRVAGHPRPHRNGDRRFAGAAGIGSPDDTWTTTAVTLSAASRSMAMATRASAAATGVAIGAVPSRRAVARISWV